MIKSLFERVVGQQDKNLGEILPVVPRAPDATDSGALTPLGSKPTN
jgi:hypothetical protein